MTALLLIVLTFAAFRPCNTPSPIVIVEDFSFAPAISPPPPVTDTSVMSVISGLKREVDGLKMQLLAATKAAAAVAVEVGVEATKPENIQPDKFARRRQLLKKACKIVGVGVGLVITQSAVGAGMRFISGRGFQLGWVGGYYHRVVDGWAKVGVKAVKGVNKAPIRQARKIVKVKRGLK